MKIGPLTILHRMHTQDAPCDTFVVAAWHPRASITWRWSLSWGPYRPYNDSFWYHEKNGGAAAGFRLPIVGNVDFHTQEFMLDKDVLKIPEMER